MQDTLLHERNHLEVVRSLQHSAESSTKLHSLFQQLTPSDVVAVDALGWNEAFSNDQFSYGLDSSEVIVRLFDENLSIYVVEVWEIQPGNGSTSLYAFDNRANAMSTYQSHRKRLRSLPSYSNV